MQTDTEYRNSIQALTALQVQMQKLSMPWTTLMETVNKAWKPIDYKLYSEALKSYSSALSKLTQKPGYFTFVQPSVDDDVPIAPVDSEPLSDVDITEVVQSSAAYSTSSIDINKVNQADLEFFRMRSKEVVDAIVNTDFEDGMENDVTELIHSYIDRNKSAAYNWLHELYSKNFTNTVLVEGLLRTLVLVTEKGDENSLLPIVIAGLRSGVSSEQEAAIMVTEEWRTKECLDALRTVQFASGWIKTYADKVIKELEKEIG